MPLSKITGNSFSSSANTNIDNSTLFVDVTNNRVGVGTNAPASDLHVAGTGNIRGHGAADSLTLVGGVTGTANRIQIRGASHPSTPNILTIDLAGGESHRFNANGAFILKGGLATVDGTGITFPASQNASSDANTLDDYEEGTWTPQINFGATSGSSTGATYAVQVGSYTKVGNLVHIQGYVSLSNKGSSTGTAFLTNLPFVSRNATNLYASAAQGWYANLTTGTNISFDLTPSASFIYLVYSGSASATTHSNSTFNNTTAFEFSFSYQTN
jgi:hypothetical protein